MQNIQDTPWYSIIASIMMIGFLLVLTTSTLNLVLQEMKDGRWRQNYLKAFAGAEWGLELALLKIKQEWFWYDEDNFSGALLWNTNLDATIWYDFESKVSVFSGNLDPYTTDIIPLFWTDASGTTFSTSGINFVSLSPDMSWNIIGNRVWISWVWDFISSDIFSSKSIGAFVDISVNDFLLTNTGSYITLYNASSTPALYTISWNGWEPFFSKPRSDIYSTARVWKYSQNLKTVVDNTEFLWVLKYSIYSWN